MDKLKVYDCDIRNLLYRYFLTRKSFTKTSTVIIDELDVCANSARIDIAVVNGQLHGYEIKSKQDNLERLPSQIIAYNKTFDTITIVGFESHIPNIIKIVPHWWGIKKITEHNGKIALKTVRKEKKNQTSDTQSIVRLLWKNEMLQLLYNTSMTKISKNKTRQQLCELIINNVDDKIIRKYVRNILKTREAWKAVSIQQINDDYSNM